LRPLRLKAFLSGLCGLSERPLRLRAGCPTLTRSLRRVGIFTPNTDPLCASVVDCFSFPLRNGFLSASFSPCHPERSEAAAEHSRRTPCFSIQPPALKGILGGLIIPDPLCVPCGENVSLRALCGFSLRSLRLTLFSAF
jgi:hypothetical protein